MKRIRKRTPSGKISFKIKKEKTATGRCGNCGNVLHGVVKGREIEIKKFAKTEKRPSRPFGGNLCSDCMRNIFRERIRNEYG